ncbi:MAG: hypothetical protein LCH61_06690 [Proteobacteria bacterium]|nr:hypothetical protein [Pseudomonadota bacterium]
MSPRQSLSGVSLLALIAATPFGLASIAEHRIAGEIAAAGGTASVHVAALTGDVTINDAAFTGLTLERMQLKGALPGLITPAFAQSGGYTLEGLKFGNDEASTSIPRLEVTGASLDKDALSTLFKPDAGIQDRVKAFSAKEIRAPEVIFRVLPKQGGRTEYTLKSVSFEDISNGRVARVSIPETTFLSDAPGMKQDGTFRASEVRGLNLGQLAHVWYDKAGPDEKPAPLYDGYNAAGMSSRVTGAANIDMTTGAMSGGALRIRPLNGETLAGAIAGILSMQPSDLNPKALPKPEERAAMAKVFRNTAEFMDAFEDDGNIIDNFQMKMGEGGKDFTFSIAKVAGTYGNTKTPPTFMLSEMSMAADGSTARLAQMGITDFSYAPMLKGMATLLEKPDFDSESLDPRSMMPRLGQVVIKGLDIDAPDPKTPKGVKPERINLKLGQFLLNLGNQVNGIPTNAVISLDNLALKLPEHSSEEGIKFIKALGYNNVDLSAKIAARWDEPTREITISDVSVSGAGMGGVRLNGTIGGIGPDALSADKDTALVALMGATAKSVSLRIDNTGLAEKLLAYQGRQQSRKPEEIRKELATMAQMVIPMVLGSSDESRAVAGALSKFALRGKSLAIDVTAKQSGGIGLPEIATLSDPASALQLVNVKATATD